MKKLLVIVLMLSIMLGMVGCGNNNDQQNNTDATNDQSQDTSNESHGITAEDENEIKSVGPNGETAVNAFTLSLTDAEKNQIREGGFKAAISFHYGGNDWSSTQLKALNDTFADLGIEVVGVTDANFAPEQQVSDLETLMALDPDVIVSIPTDPAATADAFRRVSNAGVKLVFMDNVPNGFVAGVDYVSCVSADNYGNGIVAADLIGEALNGRGNVGVVYFDVDFFVTNQRLEAFKKTMADKYPDIEIVAEMGFQDPNEASGVADAMITKHPNLDAIFAHWDVPAEGVLSSLRAAGITDIKLSTIDLGNNIAKEVAAGNILGLGAQLPYDQGVAEATLAAYALLGKEAPAYVAVPAKRVDRNNIIEAYENIYKVSAPDWLLKAKESSN
ncbi:substrate-binding domain-containing protein [Alkalibacter saccharofermentans]|uniref:Ribose transport system substrate-binding protein n=1 Tax=Alkalibacter saccharofermentans DSM 14828 TaxID=1120975 RepID=A0A1M4USR2_9FIRM|nr:substrate-binding domain-containing protein [Alkalibacter saccharofermentans]SHE59667.1 ribose transport system substrate-binding protein [Alkalibacter saccharofermentans DSM 14828]